MDRDPDRDPDEVLCGTRPFIDRNSLTYGKTISDVRSSFVFTVLDVRTQERVNRVRCKPSHVM